ncbi:hypothetical protein CON22_17975 [Bacillus cereus]|nr:hypothetical protein CON22_17975 [Bacillus cereus]
MGKNYPVDRDKKGRYRHSFVFMRGSKVSVKLFGVPDIVKGKVSTIEQYYFVIDVEDGEEVNQVTINFAAVKYIKHDCLPTVKERSPKGDSGDISTSFVFSIGDELKCAFRDGKGVKGTLLSEDGYYLYVKTEKGSYLTVMKCALDYIIHSKLEPKLLVDDFYTEEMKAGNYAKPTEYVFSVGNAVSVALNSGREFSGIVADESKYWILLNVKKGQITIFKGSVSYIKHDKYDPKAQLYVKNKRLKKQLKNMD